MKKLQITLLGIFVISVLFATPVFPFTEKVPQEKPEWHVGFQAYTFRLFSFEEALQKGASVGLKNVEAYFGQNLTKSGDVTIEYTMDKSSRQQMKNLLKKYDMTLVSAGVVTCKGEEDWRNLFDFAKEMGIQTITSEPSGEDLDLVESLADEYEINVALHNHPRPSIYWNPDSMIEALRGRSRRLGICADTGHWIRSGLNPTECVEKLGSRILTFHLKDLNAKSPDAHDVPWGTGVAEVISILSELAYQNFSGYFMIEYEYNWENSLPEVKQCVENFERMAAQALGE